MRFQAGIQITLLVVAVIIAFSVVKPKIEAIRDDQNEVASYRTAIENIGQYNQQLQSLTNQANALSAYDRAVLWRYLPEAVDATMVASDITNIVSQNRMLLLDVIPNPVTTVTTDVTDGSSTAADTGVVAEGDRSLKGALLAQRFQVEVVGTYDQMKALLRDLERNAYPLRLVEFKFDLEGESSNLVQYSLLLETYAMPAS